MIFNIGAKVIHSGLRGWNDDRSSPSVNNFGCTISACGLPPLFTHVADCKNLPEQPFHFDRNAALLTFKFKH